MLEMGENKKKGVLLLIGIIFNFLQGFISGAELEVWVGTNPNGIGNGTLSSPFDNIFSALKLFSHDKNNSTSKEGKIILLESGNIYELNEEIELENGTLEIRSQSYQIIELIVISKSGKLIKKTEGCLKFENLNFKLEVTTADQHVFAVVSYSSLYIKACSFSGYINSSSSYSDIKLIMLENSSTLILNSTSFISITAKGERMFSKINSLIHIEDSSKVIAENLNVLRGNFTEYTFITIGLSSLIELKNCNFENNIFLSENNTSIFYLANSDLVFSGGNFLNNLFSNCSIVYAVESEKISFAGIIVEGNTDNENMLSNIFGFISVSKFLSISNFFVKLNKIVGAFLKVSGILNSSLVMSNIIFLENSLGSLLEINKFETVKLSKFISSFNNMETSGPSIRFYNINDISIEQSVVTFAEASLNPPGYIIENSQSLSIISCNLTYNKRTSSDEIIKQGSALLIYNVKSTILSSCRFTGNLITLPASGGPCITFENLKGYLSVENSYFEMNRAYSFSNVIEFLGYSLNITESVFRKNINLNENTLVFGIGALNFKGFYLFLLNVIFEENLGSGGTIYLKDYKQFSSIWASNITFGFNYGSYGTAIYLDDQAKNRTVYFENSILTNNFVEYYGLIYIYIFEKIKLHNLTFVNTTFIENNSSAGSIACLWIYSGRNVYNQFFNCSFLRNIVNEGWGFSLINAYALDSGFYLTVKKCKYINNTGIEATAYILFYINFIDEDSQYIGNLAVGTSAGIYGLYNSIIKMVNIEVSKNFASYATFVYSDEAKVILTNITMKELGGNQNFFSIISFSLLEIQNIIIEKSALPQDASIFHFKNNGNHVQSIKNLSLLDQGSKTVFIIDKSNLEIIESSFFNNREILIKSSVSKILLKNLIIENVHCKSSVKGCIILAKDSEITMKKVDILNSTCEKCRGIIFLEKSIFIFETSSALNISLKQSNIFILAQQSILVKISFSAVENITGTLLYLVESKFHIESSNFNSFSKNNPLPISAFYLLDCNLVNISSSKFDNRHSKEPLLRAFTVIRSLIIVLNSNFSYFASEQGGAIFLDNSKLNLSFCEFLSNKADLGGAIFITCLDYSGIECYSEIVNSVFIENKAVYGGAIKYLFPKIKLDSVIFKDNSANSGNNIGSFTVRMVFKIYKHENNAVLQEMFKKALKNSNENIVFQVWKKTRSREVLFDSSVNNTLYVLKNQSRFSSDLGIDISIGFVDSENQPIEYDVKGTVVCGIIADAPDSVPLGIKNSNLSKNDDHSINYSRIQPKLSGTLNSPQDKERNYTIMFDNIKFEASPGSVFYLKITSSNIINIKASVFENFMAFHPNEIIDETGKYSLILPILINGCQVGELYKISGNICYKCPASTYSLDIKDADCSICPKNADCPGGFSMILNKNFWRSNIFTPEMYECNTMLGNCLGGLNSECGENFEGILCGSCRMPIRDGPIYQKSFDGKCVECLNGWGLMIVYIIFWIFFLCVKGYMARVLNSSSHPASYRITFRIWLNYFQVGILFQRYDVNLGVLMTQFGLGKYILSVVARMWFSIECVVQIVTGKFTPHFQSLFILTFLYINYFLFYSFQKFKLRKNKIASKIIKEKLIVISFILQPLLMDYLAANLNCMKIEGRWRLKSLPEIVCFDSNYLLWMCLMYIPNLIIWGILLTVFIVMDFKKIYRKKQQAVYSEAKKRKSYDAIERSFLWVGYKAVSQPHIWEVVNWIVKFLLIILNQIDVDERERYYVVFFLVSILVVYQSIFNQFSSIEFNWLIKISKYALLTIAQTLLIYTFRLNNTMNMVILVLTILAQLLFTVLSVYSAYKGKTKFLKTQMRTINFNISHK